MNKESRLRVPVGWWVSCIGCRAVWTEESGIDLQYGCRRCGRIDDHEDPWYLNRGNYPIGALVVWDETERNFHGS